jgi:hypothetical protein
MRYQTAPRPEGFSRLILRRSGRPGSNRRRELGRLLCYQLHHARARADYRFGRTESSAAAVPSLKLFDQNRPDRTQAPGRPPSMAVRTNYVAFLHLLEERIPVPIRQAGTDIEAFICQVVELEDQRIIFATVSAWSRLQILEQEPHPFLGSSPLPLGFLLDVMPPVSGVVRLSVLGLASPAVRLPLS